MKSLINILVIYNKIPFYLVAISSDAESEKENAGENTVSSFSILLIYKFIFNYALLFVTIIKHFYNLY